MWFVGSYLGGWLRLGFSCGSLFFFLGWKLLNNVSVEVSLKLLGGLHLSGASYEKAIKTQSLVSIGTAGHVDHGKPSG